MHFIAAMHVRERFPLRTYIGLSLLGVGCGFVGALSGATIASTASHRVAVTVPVVDVAPAPEVTRISSTAIMSNEAAPAPSESVGLVFELEGARWMILDIDPSEILHHRATRLVGPDADNPFATIAVLAQGDQPTALRAWFNTDVIVDGTCKDTVRDFALISQLSGDPVYADEPGDETNGGRGRWTVKSIAEHGTTVVAAKLSHCTEGSYARAAAAEPAVPFVAVDDAGLGKRAERHLLASEIAKQARAELKAQYDDVVTDPAMSFDKVTQLSTIVTSDPRTGTKWVSVHAHAEMSCGGPQVNIWGLYRMDDSELVAVREQAGGELDSINALVDLDGDGIPEILGRGWINPTQAFYSQDLEPIVSFEVPFFGCPC